MTSRVCFHYKIMGAAQSRISRPVVAQSRPGLGVALTEAGRSTRVVLHQADESTALGALEHAYS